MGSTAEKKEIVTDLKEKFAKTAFAIATDHRSLTMTELTELRKRLRKVNAEYKIAKNTLIKIAIKDTNLAELTSLLEGPTALLVGYGDVAEGAKTYVEFSKEIEKGDIKGAVLDGKLLTKQDVKTIATLPSKEVLLGQIAGLLTSNAAGIVGIFESLIRSNAMLIEEVAKKNGK